MALTLSDAKKEEMLAEVLAPNESYKAKTVFISYQTNFTVLMVALFVIILVLNMLNLSSPIIIGALSGLSVFFIMKNGYAGITQTHLNLTCLNSFNVDKIAKSEAIRLDLIENLSIKSALNQYKVKFKYQGKKYNLVVNKKIISKHLTSQAENASILADELSKFIR